MDVSRGLEINKMSDKEPEVEFPNDLQSTVMETQATFITDGVN